MRTLRYLVVLLAACGDVTANAPGPAFLTVEIAGTGTVTSTPAGISCPGTCTATFEAGTEITLAAATDAPISFAGWSSGCAANRDACALTLAEGDTKVGADFAMQGAKRWVLPGGSAQGDTFTGPMAAGSGRVAIGVQAAAATTIGGVALPEGGTFIVHIDTATHQAVWAKRIGNAGLTGLAIAADGAVIATGSFPVATDFGTGPLTPAGRDGFIAKYAADGAPLWVKQLGGAGTDAVTALAVDGDGNVYAAGGFNAVIDLGGGALTPAASPDGARDDVFVARFDGATGAYAWGKQFGNGNAEGIASVAVARGVVAFAGVFSGLVNFGGGMQLGSGDNPDAMAITLDAGTGDIQLAKQVGGAGEGYADRIAIDRSGNLVLGGHYFGAATVDGQALPAGQTFVVNYTPAGAARWMRGLTSDTQQLAVDSFGDVAIVGDFQTNLDLGGDIVLASAGQSNDPFVAKLDGDDGAARWAKRFGGTQGDFGNRVALDSVDRIYALGTFIGVADFDTETVNSDGSQFLFLISLEP